MEDVLLVGSSFVASLGGLALSVLFCVGTIKVMFRETRLSEAQLKALRERPVLGLMLPTHSTDVFGKAPEIRRRMEREALEAHKDRPLSERLQDKQ